MKRRGYFLVGIFNPRFDTNQGTLWRTAYQLGASEIFTIGSIRNNYSGDTFGSYKHIPYRNYRSIEHLIDLKPERCALIGIEQGGKSLESFSHPERACYLLGNENTGLPKEILKQCDGIVSLNGIQSNSYNVAVAGSIVLYHRVFLT